MALTLVHRSASLGPIPDGVSPSVAASSVGPIAPLSGLPASFPRTPSRSSDNAPDLRNGALASAHALLTRSDTLELASLSDCIDAVAGAFRAYGEGRSLGAGRLHLHGLGGGAFHLTAGGIAFDGARGVVGAKLNGRFPPLDGETGQRLAGAILVSDAATGMPAALLDSAVVTGLRTAAVAAVVAGTLARPDAESALLVGAGRQGRWQVDALAATGRIRRIGIADLDRASAERLADYATEQGLQAGAVDDVRAVARRSDVIVTVTPARAPFLGAADVCPGTLVIALGADAPGKQELEPELLTEALGRARHPRASRRVGRAAARARRRADDPRDSARRARGDPGGDPDGRTDARQTFVFDGTGTALQDLAAATLLVEEARRRGVGLEVALQS